MVSEANNDGNNIKWLFVVVLQSVCCFIFGCFLGDICVCRLFSQSCRPLCFQQYIGSAFLLVIQEQQYFRAFFNGYFLLVFIIIFILLSTSVQSLYTRLGFLQLPHTYNTLVSGFVFFDLVDLLLSINLLYTILLSFTLKFLTFCFKFTVKIVKNILCNGFKRNVNTMN